MLRNNNPNKKPSGRRSSVVAVAAASLALGGPLVSGADATPVPPDAKQQTDYIRSSDVHLTRSQRELDARTQKLVASLAMQSLNGPAKPSTTSATYGNNISQYINFGGRGGDQDPPDFQIATDSPVLPNGKADLAHTTSFNIQTGGNSLSIFRDYRTRTWSMVGSYAHTAKNKEPQTIGEAVLPQPNSIYIPMTPKGLHAFGVQATQLLQHAVHGDKPQVSLEIPAALVEAIVPHNKLQP